MAMHIRQDAVFFSVPAITNRNAERDVGKWPRCDLQRRLYTTDVERDGRFDVPGAFAPKSRPVIERTIPCNRAGTWEGYIVKHYMTIATAAFIAASIAGAAAQTATTTGTQRDTQSQPSGTITVTGCLQSGSGSSSSSTSTTSTTSTPGATTTGSSTNGAYILTNATMS